MIEKNDDGWELDEKVEEEQRRLVVHVGARARVYRRGAARNMWSVTRGGIVRAKSLRPRLRACEPLNPLCPSTHSLALCSRITYVCTRRVSRACVSLCLLLSLSYFLPLYPSLFFSFSVSPSDNAAKTRLTLACWPWVGRLIRYVGRRALRYSYIGTCLLACLLACLFHSLTTYLPSICGL